MDNSTYADILDNIPSAVFVITPDFAVEYYNKPFKTIFAPRADNMRVGNSINCSLLLEDENCGQGRFCHKCVLNRLLKNAVIKGRSVHREVIEKSVFCCGEEKLLKIRLSVQPIYSGTRFVCMMDDIAESDGSDPELMRRQVNKELKRAKRIQAKFLPKPGVISPVSDFRYIYRQHYQVGGDYFDLFKMDGERICGYIADVAGAGIAGGMLTVFLHDNFIPTESPAASLEKLSAKFNSYAFPDESYITAVAFCADTVLCRLKVCNAGHNMPALLVRDGQVTAVDIPGKTISGWYIGPESYSDTLIDYCAGDKLVLMTDGIADMKNSKNDEFTYERILNTVKVNSALGLDELIKAVTKEIKRFMAGAEPDTNDDCTLLAVQL